METGIYRGRAYSVNPLGIELYDGREQCAGIYGISGVYRPVASTGEPSPVLYVGSTSNLRTRVMHNHIPQLEKRKHSNPILEAAWHKYDGSTGFEFFLIERVSGDADAICEREQNWIDYYSDKVGFDCLFNICPEVGKIREMTAEERLEWGLRMKGLWAGEKNPMYGSHRAGELNPFFGRQHTEEVKQTISRKAKIRAMNGVPWKGKKHSTETRARLREVAKTRVQTQQKRDKLSRYFGGRRNDKESKPVKQLSLDGSLVRMWSSAGEAMDVTKINRSSIGRCAGKKLLKGSRSLTAGGFKWEFATLEEFATHHGLSLAEYCQRQTVEHRGY